MLFCRDCQAVGLFRVQLDPPECPSTVPSTSTGPAAAWRTAPRCELDPVACCNFWDPSDSAPAGFFKESLEVDLNLGIPPDRPRRAGQDRWIPSIALSTRSWQQLCSSLSLRPLRTPKKYCTVQNTRRPLDGFGCYDCFDCVRQLYRPLESPDSSRHVRPSDADDRKGGR
jgi:hypothetical protein